MPKRFAPLVAVFVAIVLAGCGSSSSSSTSSQASKPAASSTSTAGATTTPAVQEGFENVPIESGADIAPASTTQTGDVDGISASRPSSSPTTSTPTWPCSSTAPRAPFRAASGSPDR